MRELRAALAARRPGELCAIEGDHLLQEALRSGLEVQTIFLREDRAEDVLSLVRGVGAQSVGATGTGSPAVGALNVGKPAFSADLLPATPPGPNILLLSREAFNSAAATESSQGVAALVQRPTPRYQPGPDDLLLLAAGVQDPGNLGTLIRSAEAFGAAAVLLTDGTVDPWNGKSLRASAGSVFRVPLLRWTDPLHHTLRQHGIRLLAGVPPPNVPQRNTASPGATGASALPAAGNVFPAHLTNLRHGCVLMIGSEGTGLSPELLALADARITLTMPGPTESLNAAVAGSLLLYEAAQQRLRGGGTAA